MFKDLIDQLRSNPRLRWGVLLIIAVLWLYAVLTLRDNLEEEARLHRSAALSLARAQQQAEQTEWLTRVDPAKSLAVQLEARLWQAPSAGLAQAAFQDMLNGALQRPGIARPQVAVSLVEDALPSTTTTGNSTERAPAGDLWKVRAKVSFDAPPSTVIELLGQLENHEKQIVIGTLGVNKNLPNHTDMELYAYFQKSSAQDSNPSTKPKQPS